MKSKEEKVEQIKNYVTALLKEQNMFSKELSYQIEILAADLLIFRGITKSIEKLNGQFTVIEYSRDGNEHITIHPLIEQLRKQSDIVRKDLASLYMNHEKKHTSVNKKEKTEDTGIAMLQKLTDKMNEIGDD